VVHPFLPVEYKSREPHPGSRDYARRMGDHPPFETINLGQVLGQGPRLGVKPIRLGDPPQESDRSRVRKVPIDRFEDILLSILDVLLGA